MNVPHTRKVEDRIAELESRLEAYMSGQALAHVSKIYPKTKTVIFVGANYFGDNIKYAYLAFQDYARRYGIKNYFLTGDAAQQNMLEAAGLPHLAHSEIAHAEILLGAKVAVLHDNFHPHGAGGVVPHALLQGAKFIQLWHGIPMKEIGLKNFCQFDVMAACGPLEALVATNAASRADWAQRFSFREFAPIGYPRNDVFFRDASPADLINVDKETLAAAETARREGRAVVFYAPTNRDHIGPAWFEGAGIAALAAHCQARGYLLLINLHPSEQHAIAALRQRYPGLHFLAPGSDAYPVVKHADIVITDYSSLALDFLLLDRPLIFYRPDHDEYVAKSRHLIEGREHYTPGDVTFGIDDLIRAVDKTVAMLRLRENDPFRETRRALRQELFDHRDGESANRACELIIRHLAG